MIALHCDWNYYIFVVMYCDLRLLYVPSHTLKEYSQKTDSYESELDANVVPDGQQRLLSTACSIGKLS